MKRTGFFYLQLAFTLLVCAFLVVPVGMSALAGVTANFFQGVAKSGVTLRWVFEVWELYAETIYLSMLIALSCLVCTVVLGVPAAYVLAKKQSRLTRAIEEAAINFDPTALREDVLQLGKLIKQARELEGREIESKLQRLKELLTDEQVLGDPTMKVLIFTEHKDTLHYLVGDGRDGRPRGKLHQWGLTTTQIHGGMKVGNRDQPGTRVRAEREFKETAQVMVATEAAGEGINLQFCWFMINYDIPWNPALAASTATARSTTAWCTTLWRREPARGACCTS